MVDDFNNLIIFFLFFRFVEIILLIKIFGEKMLMESIKIKVDNVKMLFFIN